MRAFIEIFDDSISLENIVANTLNASLAVEDRSLNIKALSDARQITAEMLIGNTIKGDPFTYDDFTPEQIAELKRPASEAAQEADVATASAARAAGSANSAASNAMKVAEGLDGRMIHLEENALYGDEVLVTEGVDVVADRAVADGNGSNIAQTYQTKSAAAADKNALQGQITQNAGVVSAQGARLTTAEAALAGKADMAAFESALARKADKKIPAAAGNVAVLAADGNLQDSGIEPGTVARLDGKGELLPRHIDPLLGRQTGANTSGGYFRSTDAWLLTTSSRTFEVMFTTGDDVTSYQSIFNDLTTSNGLQVSLNNGVLKVVFQANALISHLIASGNSYHIVVSVDRAADTVSAYKNGVLSKTGTVRQTYSPGIFLLGRFNSDVDIFKGVIHHCRLFNYALAGDEVLTLWNGGRPGECMLPSGGTLRTGLVVEYLPCGLLPDKWRDTSGNGLDLAASGTPKLCYQTVPDLAVNTLAVTVTGTSVAPVYAFTQENFTQVAGAVGCGDAPMVKLSDTRTAANKPVDLSGIYPAKWNTVLNQIEVSDPGVARGFYLNGGSPASRGCVTYDTAKYVGLGVTFNAGTGYYESPGITDLTEVDMALARLTNEDIAQASSKNITLTV